MIKKIVAYRVTSLVFLAALAFAAGGLFWAWDVLGDASGGPLILHFSDMGGITATGSFTDLLLMGVLGIAVVIMNFFIAIGLEERDRVLGKVVAALTLVMAILLFLAFAAIIKVN